MEVAVVETERSQLSDKIAAPLWLQRSSFLGLPVTCLTEWIGMKWRHLKSCDFHRWLGLSFLTMQHRSFLDEVVFPSSTAWNTSKGRRYLREGGSIVQSPLSPQLYLCKWRERKIQLPNDETQALWGKIFPDSQTWVSSEKKCCLHSQTPASTSAFHCRCWNHHSVFTFRDALINITGNVIQPFTWMKGDADILLFLSFPREHLISVTLQIFKEPFTR